jgi:hypothetical protein
LVAITDQIGLQNATLIAAHIAAHTMAQIPSPSPRHVHRSATREPWCERPHPFGRRATLRSRRRGRSHHGLLTNRRRRGVLTGGKVRRPIGVMLQTTACVDS